MRAPDGGVLLRAPSPPTTARLHLLAIAILLVETIYWLAQPCAGDFIGSCAPVLGVVTGAVAAFLALGLLIHALAGRSGLLVLADALILSGTLQLVVPTSLDPEIVGFSLLALAVLAGIAGAIASLLDHRVEAALVVALLTAQALLLRAGPWWFVPAVLAVLLLVRLARPDGRANAPSTSVPPAMGGSTG